MKCPGCQEFLFGDDPRECPHCKTKVRLCHRCFGTGELKAVGSVAVEHRQRIVITCTDCSGFGLIRTE